MSSTSHVSSVCFLEWSHYIMRPFICAVEFMVQSVWCATVRPARKLGHSPARLSRMNYWVIFEGIERTAHYGCCDGTGKPEKCRSHKREASKKNTVHCQHNSLGIILHVKVCCVLVKTCSHLYGYARDDSLTSTDTATYAIFQPTHYHHTNGKWSMHSPTLLFLLTWAHL